MRTPDRLFIVTVGAQWLITVGVALAATHTGSVFGNLLDVQATIGAASNVAHGTLPSSGGPLYPLVLAPLARLTSDADSVSSVVTAINILVLGPIAAYCFLEVARRIAGRLFAALAVAIWLLAPLAVLPLFRPTYHDTYVDNVLPALFGLTVHPVYPAMVLSIVAAMFALRAVADAPRAAFAAGLLAAAAIACFPAGAGIAAGVVLSLAVARRGRGLAEALAGLAIGIVPTLIWRHRASEFPTLTLNHPTWDDFQGSMANVREFFYSNRLIQWLPVAGAIGMFRLMRPASVLTAAWIGVATLVCVATPTAFDRGQFFVDLIPAWPGYALMVAAIPALVPTLVKRLGGAVAGETPARAVSRVGVAILFVLLVLVTGLAALRVGA